MRDLTYPPIIAAARLGFRTIVLEPVPDSWGWLDALAGDVDEDFAAAVREQPDTTERPGLAKVFR